MTGKSAERLSTGISTPPTPVSQSAFPYLERNNLYRHGNSLGDVQLLWRSVLAQAIKDICSADERASVVRWLKEEDFQTVCDLAEVEAEMMLEQMASLATMPIPLAKKYGYMLRVEVMRGVHRG